MCLSLIVAMMKQCNNELPHFFDWALREWRITLLRIELIKTTESVWEESQIFNSNHIVLCMKCTNTSFTSQQQQVTVNLSMITQDYLNEWNIKRKLPSGANTTIIKWSFDELRIWRIYEVTFSSSLCSIRNGHLLDDESLFHDMGHNYFILWSRLVLQMNAFSSSGLRCDERDVIQSSLADGDHFRSGSGRVIVSISHLNDGKIKKMEYYLIRGLIACVNTF